MYLINKNHIEVNCNNKILGHRIKDEIVSVLEHKLYPKLEELLQQYDVSDEVWEIDYLPITINQVGAKNWKAELVAKTLIQIENYLKQKPLASNKRKQDGEESSIAQKIQKEIFVQDLVIQYLKTGQLPSNPLSQKLNDIFKQVTVNDLFFKKLKEEFSSEIEGVLRWSLNVPTYLKENLYRLAQSNVTFNAVLKTFAAWEVDYFKENKPSFLLKEWLEFLCWIVVFTEDRKGKQLWGNTNIQKKLIALSKAYFDFNNQGMVVVMSRIINNERTELEALKNLTPLFESTIQLIRSGDILTEDIISKKTNKKDEVNEIEDLLVALQLAEQENKRVKKESGNYIDNAGLVLVHPFLLPLFKKLNYLEDSQWRSKKQQHRAVLLVQYLTNFNPVIFENDLLLPKLFCGVPLRDTVSVKWKITTKEKKQCEQLLESVIEHWDVLKNTSVAALQETFIQRKGKLNEVKHEIYEVTVEQQSIDLLLDHLPWGIGTIKTPWMEHYLSCYWN